MPMGLRKDEVGQAQWAHTIPHKGQYRWKDLVLIKKQNETKLSSNGRNSMGNEEDKSLK